MWETRSKTFFVSELDKAIGGADLYYDRHSNIGYSRSSSFFVDGLVEKIQVLKRSDKIPDGVLSDIPDTDTRAPTDPETIFDGGGRRRVCVDSQTYGGLSM